MKLEHKLILGFLTAVLIAVNIAHLGSIFFAGGNVLFILAFALVLGFAWGMFFSRLILKRLFELQEVVAEIAQGNLTKRIIVKSKDEIGKLCMTFNEMVNKLQEANQMLEKAVRERTGEIEILKTSLEEKVKERTAQLEGSKIDLEKTVDERTKELHEKIATLEKLNHVMIGREMRMIELKKEIEELKKIKPC